MKLYSVSVRWTPKGMRKARGAYSYVFAETKEEARAKFEARISLPNLDDIRDRYIDWWISENDNEVIVTRYY
jgi:hypothetical protein